MMEPIADRQDEEGNYYSTRFCRLARDPSRKRWNATRFGRSWQKRWPRWEKSIAKCLCCATCST